MPIVIEVEGAGFFSVTQYQNDLWVSNIVSNKRGDGNKVLKAMIKYAKDRKKTLYGALNPTSGMSAERLGKWYERYGGQVLNDNIVKY